MSLLHIIKRNPDVRRIFGERELKIIEKQLWGVRLKPSEKVRLSRDIRKKLAIVRELSRFSDHFHLKKAALIHETVEKTKQTIFLDELFPRVKKIILFGSAVENELRLGSDVDIAVEFIKITSQEAFKFRSRIAGNVSDKVDIQIYNVLPEKIKKEIDMHGRVIYERED